MEIIIDQTEEKGDFDPGLMWGQYQYGGEAKDVCRIGDMGPAYIRSRKEEDERGLWKGKGLGGGRRQES